MALQKRFDVLQDQEIELLERYASAATSESRQREALHELFALVSASCREEMALRETRRRERLDKLHAYCGSSSVSVERDDKKHVV